MKSRQSKVAFASGSAAKSSTLIPQYHREDSDSCISSMVLFFFVQGSTLTRCIPQNHEGRPDKKTSRKPAKQEHSSGRKAKYSRQSWSHQAHTLRLLWMIKHHMYTHYIQAPYVKLGVKTSLLGTECITCEGPRFFTLVQRRKIRFLPWMPKFPDWRSAWSRSGRPAALISLSTRLRPNIVRTAPETSIGLQKCCKQSHATTLCTYCQNCDGTVS